jgi:hypothetical protein
MGTGQAPLERTIEATVPAVGAAADDSTVIGEAPFACTVTGVNYAPEAAITGANTDTRTITLVNRGQAGSGSTVVATLALTAGVNAAAYDDKGFTLSVVAGATTLAAGDVLEWRSTHSGSTGLADPGGHVRVTVARA